MCMVPGACRAKTANQERRLFYDVNRDDFFCFSLMCSAGHQMTQQIGTAGKIVVEASAGERTGPACRRHRCRNRSLCRKIESSWRNSRPTLRPCRIRSCEVHCADMLPPAGNAKLDAHIVPPAGDAKVAAHIWGDPNQDWLFEDRELAMKSWAGDVAAAWPA